MTSPVLTALVDQRREILREMAVLRDDLAQCEEAVVHIDAVIRLIDPAFNVAEVIAKKRFTEDEVFRPGEAPIMALDALREAGRPMSTTEITKALLEKKGFPRLTARQFDTLNRKINAGLNSKFRKGILRKAGRETGHGTNRAVIWELI